LSTRQALSNSSMLRLLLTVLQSPLLKNKLIKYRIKDTSFWCLFYYTLLKL
jgi:hypothetical protein